MAAAAKLRLIDALDDFIRSYAGDGGRAPRSAQAGTDADLVTEAQAFRSKLSRGSEQSDTPGGRASKRGSEGGGFDAAADRARDMFRKGA